MTTIDHYFDRIFIINLDHRQDRWCRAVKRLRLLGIKNYERFSAIKPTHTLVVGQKNWLKTYRHLKQHGLNGTNTTDSYALGCLGCKLSHYFVLALALQRGYSRVLILEDDAELFQDADATFSQVLKELPQNWNMLYLMANHARPPAEVTEHIVQTVCSATTGAYAVQRSFIPLLMDAVSQDVGEIDVTYMLLQPHFPMYCCRPHLCRQEPGFSDIRGESLDYSIFGT